MPAPLTSMEQVELEARLQQFKSTPGNQRTTQLPGMSFEHCDTSQLFDVFCYGEPTEVEVTQFLEHISQCVPCHNGFVRLLWMSTD